MGGRVRLAGLSPGVRVRVSADVASNVGAAMSKLGPRAKYGAHRTEGWDSKAERTYWDQLQLLETAGDIRDLRRQVRVPLGIGQRYFRMDFVYWDNRLDEWIFDDFKGFATPEWKLKADIWAAGFGPGILRITTRKRKYYHHEDRHPADLDTLIERIKATRAFEHVEGATG